MLELLEDEARPRQKPKMEVLLVKSPEVGGYGERGQGKRDGFCECCASRSWQLIAACNEHVLAAQQSWLQYCHTACPCWQPTAVAAPPALSPQFDALIAAEANEKAAAAAAAAEEAAEKTAAAAAEKKEEGVEAAAEATPAEEATEEAPAAEVEPAAA
jgi:hypothetical protein